MGTDTDRLEYSTGLFALIFSLDMSTIVAESQSQSADLGKLEIDILTWNYGMKLKIGICAHYTLCTDADF